MKPTARRFGQCCWPLALAAALITCVTGCLVIPTPEFNTGRARANINRQPPKQLEPGRATRAEVMMVLGEPDAVTPDESKLAYRSEKVCGLWCVGGYGSATGGTITKDRYLVVEFDAQGVLHKAQRSSTFCGSMQAGQLLSSSDGSVGPGCSDATTPDEQPMLKFRATDFAGVEGYHGKGQAPWTGQPGRLLIYSTHLDFMSDAEFANSGPAFTLPYDSLAEVRVARSLLHRRVVVRTRAGAVHSFEIHDPEGVVRGKPAFQTVADYLRTKARP